MAGAARSAPASHSGAKAINSGSARAEPSHGKTPPSFCVLSLARGHRNDLEALFFGRRLFDRQVGLVVGKPVVVCLGKQHADQSEASVTVGKDTDNASAPPAYGPKIGSA